MSKQVFLLGCGGHGRVILDTLLSRGIYVNGIIDPGLKIGDQMFGISVVGGDNFLDHLNPIDVFLINGLGANPSVQSRKKIFEDLKTRGFSFTGIRHPSSVVGLECDLGQSSQIMAGVVLQNRVHIGDNVVINTRASIDHDCSIDSHTFICAGVVLCGGVLVGKSVFIGAGAVVLPSVKIGANVIIGAGAVVTKNIPEGRVVVGNIIYPINWTRT